MSINSARIGLLEELLAATAVADTNAHACSEDLQAQGNSAQIFLTSTDVLDTVTITVEVSNDGTTWYETDDSWEIEVDAADTYFLALDGLRTTPGDYIRVYYQCESAAGTIAIKGRTWEDAGGGGGGGSIDASSLSTLATEATLDDVKTAVELLDNIVSGSEAQVDVVSSALPTGAATEATLGSVQTAVELIDDTVGTEDAAVGTKGLQLSGEARSALKAAVDSGDVVLLVSNLNGQLAIAGYDWDGDFNRSGEVDPLDQQYVPGSSVLTNVPNATPDETVIIDMDGFRGLCIHIEKTGGSDAFTATVEASGEGSDSGYDWIDVTRYGFTAAHAATAASYTADCILFLNPGFSPRAVKVKITTAGTGNDADFNVFWKKWY